MDVDVAYSAAAAAGDGGYLELKRFTMVFFSHYCSAIPSVMDDAGKGEPDKKQKRSASKSFLVPCGNGSVKKQSVAHCGGLEALKVEERGDNVPFKKQCVTDYGGSETLEELGEGAKVSSEGFLALQRRSFTPNTARKKVGFSIASGETPKSASSLISPGEEFWNAAIEFADGISALADKGPRRPECDAAEDKSSCAVALCSKTLPRSGNGHFDCENTVGSNDTKQMDKFSNKVESVAANSQHKNSSPLPVKHLDFFHVDEIQVSALKDKEKGGTIPGSVHVDLGQLKDGSFHRRKTLIHSVDDIKKNTLDLHADSSAMIPGEELLKSTAAGKGHSTGVCDKGSRMIKRDLNQLTHGGDKSFAAYSNCGKPNKNSKSKFASQEVEASTPSSLPPKDHSKLSSWLPPELCAVYMKKGISELYPWQVECLLVEGVLENRNLVYCASTSAGKSFVAEVLMLRRIFSGGKMAVLVLPYVSICAEKAEHLEQLLEPMGRHVRGFYRNQGGGSLPKDTSVAVCTIEKANSLVNKLLEDGRLSELGIIVIDELHMVGDQHRGYLLELMLTKLRYAAGEGNSESSSGETSGSSSGKTDATHGLQIIGMSATMPNVAAVADWLQAALYQTDFRPVLLEEFYQSGQSNI